MRDLSREALSLHASHALTPDETERLALEAYYHIAPQVMSVQERAFMATGAYFDSRNLHPSLRMLDEAVLCFEAECFTAALALLFIVLERYLRCVANWAPGQPNLSFLQLREAIMKFPASTERYESRAILDRLYAYYNAASPPQFYFNRHGLLHGMRPQADVDRLNCARIFMLFDKLCAAEGQSRIVTNMPALQMRIEMYLSGRWPNSPASDQLLYGSTP